MFSIWFGWYGIPPCASHIVMCLRSGSPGTRTSVEPAACGMNEYEIFHLQTRNSSVSIGIQYGCKCVDSEEKV